MNERINDFSDYIYREEKSMAMWEKHLRDTKAFCVHAGGKSVTKDLVQHTVNKAALLSLAERFSAPQAGCCLCCICGQKWKNNGQKYQNGVAPLNASAQFDMLLINNDFDGACTDIEKMILMTGDFHGCTAPDLHSA